MSFLWSWNTRDDYGGPGSSASLYDIYDVIKLACGVDEWCDSSDDINWDGLMAAAEAKWGLDTPGYDNFMGWANAHGVRD